MTTTCFDYAVVRFVGDPVRGEGLNVAVLVLGGEPTEGRLQMDPQASLRLRGVWPEFNRGVYLSTMRDLRHHVGEVHQVMLEESNSASSPTVAALDHLRAVMANQYQLGPLRRFYAETIDDAATTLFERLVDARRKEPSKDRYMTRAALRRLIVSIFSNWARVQGETVSLETDGALEGQDALHQADMVVSRNGEPEIAFYAMPVGGPGLRWSQLIRDSLPTVVQDVRARHPGTRFYAVLPEGAQAREKLAAGKILRNLDGLTVLDVAELRQEFSTQGDAVAAGVFG